MINGLLVLSVLVLNNVLLTNGFGVLSLQRNKNNLLFVLYNCFTMVLVLLACTSLYGVVYTYLLDPYNLEILGILVIVLFAAISNFGVLEITKLVNKEMYYYYDVTYSFVINMGITIAMLFVMDFAVDFGVLIVNASLIATAYVIATMVFAFAYPKLHNNRIPRLFRPVPITIIAMSIVAMVIYAISISI